MSQDPKLSDYSFLDPKFLLSIQNGEKVINDMCLHNFTILLNMNFGQTMLAL